MIGSSESIFAWLLADGMAAAAVIRGFSVVVERSAAATVVVLYNLGKTLKGGAVVGARG